MDETQPLLTKETSLPNPSDNQSSTYRRTFGAKLGHFCSLITVEPCIFFYLLVFSLQNILVTNFIVEKACQIHFNYTEEICSNITHYPSENSHVQKYVNKLNLCISFIETIPTLFFTLILGSWGDKYGRKLPLLLPLIGFVLSTLILLVNLLVWSAVPEYILLASIPKAITGGLPCLLMTCYAYITDLTNTENRTMRIGLVDFSFAVGPLLGFLLADIGFKTLGYTGVFAFSAIVSTICIFYVFFVVVETTGPYKGRKYWFLDGFVPNENDVRPDIAICGFGHIIESLRVGFKQRPNYGRLKIIFCMMALSIMVSTYDIFSVEFLFASKVLHWTYLQYLHYLIFVTGTMTIGAPFLLSYLTLKLKIRDMLLSVVGSFMKMSSFIFEAFVSRSWMMYGVGVAGFLGFLPIIALRSFISKIVAPQETGQIFSILSCIEIALPLCSKTAFTFVYNSTLDTFAGAVFLIAAGLQGISCLFALVVLLLDGRIHVNESPTPATVH